MTHPQDLPPLHVQEHAQEGGRTPPYSDRVKCKSCENGSGPNGCTDCLNTGHDPAAFAGGIDAALNDAYAEGRADEREASNRAMAEVGWVLVESANNEYGREARPYLGTELLDLPLGRHALYAAASVQSHREAGESIWQSQCKDGTWVDCDEANAKAGENYGFKARKLYTAPPSLSAPVPADGGRAVPEGWKLVPAKPTKEMVRAMSTIPSTAVIEGERCVGIGGAIDAYRAMLAAAPSVSLPATQPVGFIRPAITASEKDRSRWVFIDFYEGRNPALAWEPVYRSLPVADCGVEAGWRPIETAPLEGEFLACIEVQNVSDGREWWEQHVLRMDGEFIAIDADYDKGWDLEDYAGWQPLPPLPAPKDSGAPHEEGGVVTGGEGRQ